MFYSKKQQNSFQEYLNANCLRDEVYGRIINQNVQSARELLLLEPFFPPYFCIERTSNKQKISVSYQKTRWELD